MGWQFERKGAIVVDKAAASEDDLCSRRSRRGPDLSDQTDTWLVTTPPPTPLRHRVAHRRGIAFVSAELTMIPSTTVAISDAPAAKQVLRVVDALEEHDDVQNVYANFDMADDVLQAVMA